MSKSHCLEPSKHSTNCECENFNNNIKNAVKYIILTEKKKNILKLKNLISIKKMDFPNTKKLTKKRKKKLKSCEKL